MITRESEVTGKQFVLACGAFEFRCLCADTVFLGLRDGFFERRDAFAQQQMVREHLRYRVAYELVCKHWDTAG